MRAKGRTRLYGWLLACAMLAGCASSPAEAPGSTSRTLSNAEVDALLAGDGFGMAAPAEINGYPGPAHVLELKEALELSPDQRFATSRLVGLMRGQARALGQRIVDAEKRLDADLADGNITGAGVRARLDTIAALRAQLRYVHIDAHLEQKKILKPEQIARYYELRGRVVVREPTLPPQPSEPLTLPVEAPAATPAAVAPVTAPAALPALPKTPPEEAAAAALDAVPAAQAPVAAPVHERVPEANPGLSVQPVLLPPGPDTDGVIIEIEPAPESEQAAPSPEDMSPAEQISPISPGAQDAMEDAEPAREPPAYPLTPVEENQAPPALLLEEAPVAETVEEETPGENVPAMSPGAQDAMEDAEPVRELQAHPLTPVEENQAPPALLEDAPLEVETTDETPVEEIPALSPGMQDAIEFAEPDSGVIDVKEEPALIAPLEDDGDLQTLEPSDPREPVTIDLDN